MGSPKVTQDPRLSLEAPAKLAIAQEVPVEHLERDALALRQAKGVVDGPGPSFTQHPEHLETIADLHPAASGGIEEDDGRAIDA